MSNKMTSEFDWRLVHIPAWTPLSRIGIPVTHVVDGLYKLTDCIYALTNTIYNPVADPGIGAFLWARSAAASLLIYHRTPFDDNTEGPHCPPPPPEILGHPSTTYGSVIAHSKAIGIQPQVNASYNMHDGAFLITEVLTTPDRSYIYRSLNTPDNEPAMAIMFNLHSNGMYQP